MQVAAGEIQLGTVEADGLPVAFIGGARLVDCPLGRRTRILGLNALLPVIGGLFFVKLCLGPRQGGPGDPAKLVSSRSLSLAPMIVLPTPYESCVEAASESDDPGRGR